MNLNLAEMQKTVVRSYGRGSLILKKYSPEILLGAGIIGTVVAAVLAAKATLKVEELVEHHAHSMEKIDIVANSEDRPEEYTKEFELKDRAIVYTQTALAFGKLYGPSVGLGVLSIGAILGAHGIMSRRQVSLIAAYGLLAETYQGYRQRVIDQLGPTEDLKFHLGLKEETQTETTLDEDGNKVKTKKKVLVSKYQTKSIYSRFFDESNPMFRTDRTMNKAFLLARQNMMNDLLTIRGHVFLNEVYQELGFEHTKEGQLVGWVLKSPEQMKEEGRDGFIDFGIFDVENDPGREFVNGTNPSILLDFNVDGIVYNLI